MVARPRPKKRYKKAVLVVDPTQFDRGSENGPRHLYSFIARVQNKNNRLEAPNPNIHFGIYCYYFWEFQGHGIRGVTDSHSSNEPPRTEREGGSLIAQIKHTAKNWPRSQEVRERPVTLRCRINEEPTLATTYDTDAAYCRMWSETGAGVADGTVALTVTIGSR
ncbi:hypothetical protein EVAR_102873_1 [Eumeta japonica]|uniref:Uncharacterized protein n=1 Tax=Eumeta variegata TaxID=151549 RepID=A0A4C1UMR8_EUMVA|nr:hypothetical protein EVAR_102873_1 [Eumeta japonica]